MKQTIVEKRRDWWVDQDREDSLVRMVHVPEHGHRGETDGDKHAAKDQRDPEQDAFEAV